MAQLKTRPRGGGVTEFINAIPDPERRRECRTLARIMGQITKQRPKMWGPSIVGFGSYHYRYESGREGDWFLTGFSPRKQALTLYIMAGFGNYDTLLRKLGSHKTGKSCLYLKRLADVDLAVLKQLIRQSVQHMARTSR